ncbi:Long-chain fatty acid transport protein 4 [Orchesella cincta]|uniref:Very long-chain fatty acid transport protein n=1 Tax=Orchesella cincta TaxID=48709 RepID=A0A1D2ME63_ORCCI|nr:Long-chain fatty acid transport protein 4 [Orchesella cincta]
MTTSGLHFFYFILAAIIILLLLGLSVWCIVNRRLLCATIVTLPRDVTALTRLIKILGHFLYLQRNNLTVGQVFDKNARKDPEKVIIRFENERWTNEQVQILANKIANYFQSQGFKKGDSVALFMENCPEYLCMWLGLSKIGVVGALINCNLRLQSLQHCLEAVNCQAVIYNEELSHALQDVIAIGGLNGTPLYSLCPTENSPSITPSIHLRTELEKVKCSQPEIKEKVGFQDVLFYTYTSGTTGLPKAAVIKHSRYLIAATAMFCLNNFQKDDVIYTTLPLYHGAANVLGGGAALCHGVEIVIRKKFSARNFWKDCIHYNVTVAQYIGEICRYLLSQPPSEHDRNHQVRTMVGNGLRKEIWSEFVGRFNISEIIEVYGATEGNCNMGNIDSKVGAVGFIPSYLNWAIPYWLIKVDEVTGDPIRGKNGKVIVCGPDEPGELIGKIERNHPIRDYLGYADKSSSEGKVLENAFRKGDAYFRSGDILVRDIYGYFYFNDRKGDTFRWKGENVSTAEVESVISSLIGLADVVVYGVEVPGTEGRVGMAAIADPEQSIDFDELANEIFTTLPSYARPVFVRIVSQIQKTGTYKLQKTTYQREGFDVTKTKDKMYILIGKRYAELTQNVYDDIIKRKIKF